MSYCAGHCGDVGLGDMLVAKRRLCFVRGVVAAMGEPRHLRGDESGAGCANVGAKLGLGVRRVRLLSRVICVYIHNNHAYTLPLTSSQENAFAVHNGTMYFTLLLRLEKSKSWTARPYCRSQMSSDITVHLPSLHPNNFEICLLLAGDCHLVELGILPFYLPI